MPLLFLCNWAIVGECLVDRLVIRWSHWPDFKCQLFGHCLIKIWCSSCPREVQGLETWGLMRRRTGVIISPPLNLSRHFGDWRFFHQSSSLRFAIMAALWSASLVVAWLLDHQNHNQTFKSIPLIHTPRRPRPIVVRRPQLIIILIAHRSVHFDRGDILTSSFFQEFHSFTFFHFYPTHTWALHRSRRLVPLENTSSTSNTSPTTSSLINFELVLSLPKW